MNIMMRKKRKKKHKTTQENPKEKEKWLGLEKLFAFHSVFYLYLGKPPTDFQIQLSFSAAEGADSQHSGEMCHEWHVSASTQYITSILSFPWWGRDRQYEPSTIVSTACLWRRQKKDYYAFSKVHWVSVLQFQLLSQNNILRKPDNRSCVMLLEWISSAY